MEKPIEFLGRLQRHYAKPIPAHELYDAEYSQVTIDQIKKAGLDISNIGDCLGVAMAICVLNILSHLPEEDATLVKDKIAFGILATGSINALIFRSHEDNYAIALNRGFMVFLNKFLKISLTQCSDALTTFIDQETKKQIAQGGVNAVYEILRRNYFELGEPIGVNVTPIERVQITAAHMLHWAESFTICHELGHFFNGDLSRGVAADRFNCPESPVERLVYPKDHKMEFLADLSGYAIYRECCGKVVGKDNQAELLTPVVCLFDALSYLSYNETATHPLPLKRLLNIAFCAHGPDAANYWLNSYRNVLSDIEFGDLAKFLGELTLSSKEQ